MEADNDNKPVLLLDPLHHFYNEDLEMSVRDRILNDCCRFIKRISLSNPVAMLVPKLEIEDHKHFFPILAANADEVIPVVEASEMVTIQASLF